MKRRKFIQYSSLALGSLSLPGFGLSQSGKGKASSFTGKIMTVNGAIAPDDLGPCLTHEHILSRFGLDPMEPPAYDREKVLKEVWPYLNYIRELGAQSIMEFTIGIREAQ